MMKLSAFLKSLRHRGRARACCVVALMLIVGGCFENQPPKRTGNLLDDKVISARVESALHANADDHLDQVHATTTNAVVTLSGNVGSPEQKEKAAFLADRVDQVRQVQNEIVVGTQKP